MSRIDREIHRLAASEPALNVGDACGHARLVDPDSEDDDVRVAELALDGGGVASKRCVAAKELEITLTHLRAAKPRSL